MRYGALLAFLGVAGQPGQLSPRDRMAAAESLARPGDDRAANDLCMTVRGDPATYVRSAAARALAIVSTERAAACLVDALGDSSADVRRHLRDALVRIGRPAAGGLARALEGADAVRTWQLRSILDRIETPPRPPLPAPPPCREPARPLVWRGVQYPRYPQLMPVRPRLVSPVNAGGREYLVVLTKEARFGLPEATIENCTEKGRQLLVGAADFPALAKTGLHDDGELDRTHKITDRMVEEITDLAQPGGLSHDGFLAPDEDILGVLKGDNLQVRALGLTHAQLARPLFHVWNLIQKDLKLGRWNTARHRWDFARAIFCNGRQVTVDANDTKGGQESIFDDGLNGSFHIRIDRPPDAAELSLLRARYGGLPAERREAMMRALSRLETGELQPYYIMRYGFYEGHTMWRTGPIAIAFVFGMRNLKEIEAAFPGRLDRALLDHYTPAAAR